MSARISAVVITCNESANIEACLASLAWCEEIIVLDSGSTDATVAMARAAGAQVHVTPDWPGFGTQKQRALELATGDWVLALDADERVSPAGRDEILTAIAQGDADAYLVPRRSLYVSRFMQHSDWWPDHVLRLARRSQARYTDDVVHERMEVQGRIGTLSEPLEHLSYRDFESVLQKVNAYSSAGARQLHARGKQTSLMSAILHGMAMFLRTYIVKRGFLDGAEGFILAVSNAQASFWKYIKLRELNRRQQERLPQK
jgi:glycosyltransferase involved in cell wall biosynthesis